jgi:hypothetical protein
MPPKGLVQPTNHVHGNPSTNFLTDCQVLIEAAATKNTLKYRWSGQIRRPNFLTLFKPWLKLQPAGRKDTVWNIDDQAKHTSIHYTQHAEARVFKINRGNLQIYGNAFIADWAQNSACYQHSEPASPRILMSLTCLWRNCFGSHVTKRKKVAPAIHQLSTFAKNKLQ